MSRDAVELLVLFVVVGLFVALLPEEAAATAGILGLGALAV